MHARGEKLAQAMQLHGHRGIFATQLRRDFLDGRFIAVSTMDERARRSVELLEAIAKRRQFASLVPGAAGGNSLVDQRFEFFVAADAGNPEFPPVIAEEVECDAAQPRAERPFAIELREFSKSGDERLLRKIFRLVGTFEPDGQTGAHRDLMPADQFGERGPVAVLGGAHKISLCLLFE